MESILHYLYQYVKFGKFTTVFLVVIGAVIVLKFLPKPRLMIPKRALLIAILLLGLFLRIGWLNYSAHTPMTEWKTDHMLENDWINVHAIELAEHGTWFHGPSGLPSGRRPIGYPMFLALFYKILGPHLAVAWSLNLLLYGVTILFLFGMARRLFDENVALMTALLFAIYPMSIYSVKLLTDEHLFLPVWYGGLYLLVRMLDGRKVPLDWLWLGIIFGYATMIRTHTIFMPFVVGLTFWLMKRPVKEIVAKAILVALVMNLVNLPWVIRNYRAWGVPVLYTATGSFVYSQVNSTATPEGGGHIPIEGEPDYSPELDTAIKSGNEGVVHQISNRLMKQWIFQHPRQFLELGPSRLLDFMCFNRKSGVWAIWHQYYPGSYDPEKPLPEKLRQFLEESSFAFYYVLFFSWILGMILLIRRWKTIPVVTQKGLLLFGFCFLFWFMEHMVIYPDRKYRFPLEPLMLISVSYFFLYFSCPAVISKMIKKLIHRTPSGQ